MASKKPVVKAGKPAPKTVVKAGKPAPKTVVKAGKPAPKTVEKKPEKIVANIVAPGVKKIQTAEGWKRSMKKAHGK